MNPRPIIRFADVVCIGEGETWIVSALRILEQDFRVDALASLPGTIISGNWQNGDSLPKPNEERPVPKNPAYLNKAIKGHAATWYLEMARGCPFSCHYCELGNTLAYRTQDTQFLLDQVDAVDMKQSKKISLFAPDEASHKGYGEILERIHSRGLITQFGSMRFEMVIKRNLPLKPNMLIRVGMDGLTQETRFRVGRKQTDEYFLEYFRFMTDRGHANFKIFMIIGYPWETSADLDGWIGLMTRIGEIPRKVNAHVRIKITPLIPQPTTPLHAAEARYDLSIIRRMEAWIENWRPKRATGWFFDQDGRVMNYRTWRLQCAITNGNEDYFDVAA